jgi:hypothetical protein
MFEATIALLWLGSAPTLAVHRSRCTVVRIATSAISMRCGSNWRHLTIVIGVALCDLLSARRSIVWIAYPHGSIGWHLAIRHVGDE